MWCVQAPVSHQDKQVIVSQQSGWHNCLFASAGVYAGLFLHETYLKVSRKGADGVNKVKVRLVCVHGGVADAFKRM